MLMLGINEGFDASVVLSRDGTILFAVQEERLTREKGTIGFPTQAVPLHQTVRLKRIQPASRLSEQSVQSEIRNP